MQSEPTAFRISDPEIRALFSDESKYESWLDVEAVLAQSQAEIPDVSSRLTPEQIADLLDPTSYTGVCSLFAERAALKAREVSDSIR